MVEVPRRKFNIDIDGKIFVAKELSVAYLQETYENRELDSAEYAIKDSIGEIHAEELKHFGIDTMNLVYAEIIKFTFNPTLSAEDYKEICSEFNMKLEEVKALDRSAQIQMKNLVGARKPRDKESEKKI